MSSHSSPLWYTDCWIEIYSLVLFLVFSLWLSLLLWHGSLEQKHVSANDTGSCNCIMMSSYRGHCPRIQNICSRMKDIYFRIQDIYLHKFRDKFSYQGHMSRYQEHMLYVSRTYVLYLGHMPLYRGHMFLYRGHMSPYQGHVSLICGHPYNAGYVLGWLSDAIKGSHRGSMAAGPSQHPSRITGRHHGSPVKRTDDDDGPGCWRRNFSGWLISLMWRGLRDFLSDMFFHPPECIRRKYSTVFFCEDSLTVELSLGTLGLRVSLG